MTEIGIHLSTSLSRSNDNCELRMSMDLSSTFFDRHYHLREIFYQIVSYSSVRSELIDWIYNVSAASHRIIISKRVIQVSCALRLSTIEQDLCVQIFDRYVSSVTEMSDFCNMAMCALIVAVKMFDVSKATRLLQVPKSP
jgi:hypothetical protein